MIVKIKYFTARYSRRQKPAPGTTQKPKTLKQRVKANARYIAHRRGKDGEKMSRERFGHDGKLTKEQIYQMIDTAKKDTWFYKLVISPDPRMEDAYKDLDLRALTSQTIAEFEATIGMKVQFFAAIHSDHRPHR